MLLPAPRAPARRTSKLTSLLYVDWAEMSSFGATGKGGKGGKGRGACLRSGPVKGTKPLTRTVFRTCGTPSAKPHQVLARDKTACFSCSATLSSRRKIGMFKCHGGHQNPNSKNSKGLRASSALRAFWPTPPWSSVRSSQRPPPPRSRCASGAPPPSAASGRGRWGSP